MPVSEDDVLIFEENAFVYRRTHRRFYFTVEYRSNRLDISLLVSSRALDVERSYSVVYNQRINWERVAKHRL